jgi:Ig-like domain from next to BRCA1 gene
MKVKKTILISLLLITSILLGACGPSEADMTPTLSVEEVQTMVVSTLAFGMTQTAMAAPTNTSTPTATPTIATLVSPTTGVQITPFGTTVGTGGGAACYALSFLSDVTIPDNTAMKPGETFTKTWRVKNSGTCAWDVGFKFAFTSGDAMNGATYSLAQAVPANTETNLSVTMTAPNKAGSIKSSWRMSTAAGQFFGDEIYVLIAVGGAAAAGTATNTSNAPAAATNTVAPPTSTPTVTPTP